MGGAILAALRLFFTEAISNDCVVGAENKSAKGLVNLDDIAPALKQTGFVEHSFWTSCSATGQVSGALDQYKRFSATLADMIKFVFLEHTKFTGTPKTDVSASDLRQWCQLVPEGLAVWAEPDICEKVGSLFVSVCEAKEKALFSAGLTAIQGVAEQCLSGATPPLPESAQAQLLLKIPKAHKLRGLVASFLEVGHRSWNSCVVLDIAPQLPLYTTQTRKRFGHRDSFVRFIPNV